MITLAWQGQNADLADINTVTAPAGAPAHSSVAKIDHDAAKVRLAIQVN